MDLLGNYHFWAIVIMFIIVIFLHYPQLLFTSANDTAIFPWLSRHAIERVFLLVPITYASFIFGIRGGIISIIVSLAIMIPRSIFISPVSPDAIFESMGVVIVGCVINYWFYIYNKNIAQRKRIEDMLVKIVDGSTVAAFVIDKDHKVTHWNTAIESLTGIRKNEIIGTSDQWRAFYDDKRWTLADLLINRATEDELQKVYNNVCTPSPLIKGAYEVENFFPDLGDKGRWLHFTASAIKDSNGEITGAVETLTDVTARKNAEVNLKFYLKEITKAQEEERKRIARELHDDTAQNLIALLHQLEYMLNDKEKLPLKEAQTLWGFYERIRDILQEVRHFSRDLRPSVLDDLGLLPALEYVTDDLKSNYWVETSLIVTGDERRLSNEAELLLFRIVQEALRNIAKHAKASTAKVIVEFNQDKILITIKDDGVGFELPDNLGSLPHAGKLGLTGLQERVQLLGGTLKISSEMGKGTTIVVEAPI